MSSTLRWGILGTGNIARQFAAGVAASRRGRLAAVGSRAAATAEAFASAFSIPVAHGSYERLLDDPGVDAAYVSLPNTMHHEWSIKALRAGKHVLCEKPIAADARQAGEMFDAASASGRVLMEAFMYRSHPLTLAVSQAVRLGEIGELRLIRTSFCFHTTRVAGNIRFDPSLAGGALMDIGCYCVNFSRYFAQAEPKTAHATGRIHPTGVDEMAAGTLTFPGGVVASFTCGMGFHADNTASLCGTNGFIDIPVPWKPAKGKSAYVLSRGAPPLMDKRPVPPGPPPREVRNVPFDGDLYGIEADDFAATVLDGLPPRVSREDSVGNMKVLDNLRSQVRVNRDGGG